MLDMMLSIQQSMFDTSERMIRVMQGSVDRSLTVPFSTSTALTVHQGTTQPGEQVISLGEEVMNVEAQRIPGATTRVRRFVVETPVEQEVVLHDEKVVVERRRPINAVANDTLTNKIVEATESHETAVIHKGVRLVEEVVLRTERNERRQKLRGTVRRDEVEIIEPGQQMSPHREVVKAPGAKVEVRATAQEPKAAAPELRPMAPQQKVNS